MRPYTLHTVTVTLRRYGPQTIDPATYLPTATATDMEVVVQEEPWRADASPPRPDGETEGSTRLFVSTAELRGATDPGTATPEPADRIVTSDGTVWRVVEVVRAPGIGPIAPCWHGYCVRVRPEDETGVAA